MYRYDEVVLLLHTPYPIFDITDKIKTDCKSVLCSSSLYGFSTTSYCLIEFGKYREK